MPNNGHRIRLKKRFLSDGLKSFQVHEVLELLLFYAIPRKNTNQIAHNLLGVFGSFEKVVDAPAHELTKINGVTENVAILINLIPKLTSYYLSDKQVNISDIVDTEDIAQKMIPIFLDAKKESVYIVCLTDDRRIIAIELIDNGDYDFCGISAKSIVEVALKHNSSLIVLIHNHSDIGNGLKPSAEDILTTTSLMKMLEPLDIIIYDHIIISETNYLSMLNSEVTYIY